MLSVFSLKLIKKGHKSSPGHKLCRLINARELVKLAKNTFLFFNLKNATAIQNLNTSHYSFKSHLLLPPPPPPPPPHGDDGILS